MLRTRGSTRTRYFLGRFRHPYVLCYRFQSQFVKPTPPKIDKNANFLVKSLNYVKKVDDYQESLFNSPSKAKIQELMSRIEDKPEILYLLSIFLQELEKLGINQHKREVSKFRYRVMYFLKLHKLHTNFWEICNVLEISSQSHKLSLDPANIGLLDPANFSPDDYEQLRRGIYKETDFRELVHISFIKPDFKK